MQFQPWETNNDPESRILLQVKIQDAIEADEIFDNAYGVTMLSRVKEFIELHAKYVKNLDI